MDRAPPRHANLAALDPPPWADVRSAANLLLEVTGTFASASLPDEVPFCPLHQDEPARWCTRISHSR
jgi:hypothetical protein